MEPTVVSADKREGVGRSTATSLLCSDRSKEMLKCTHPDLDELIDRVGEEMKLAKATGLIYLDLAVPIACHESNWTHLIVATSLPGAIHVLCARVPVHPSMDQSRISRA
jgi:hypothetical protein